MMTLESRINYTFAYEVQVFGVVRPFLNVITGTLGV